DRRVEIHIPTPHAVFEPRDGVVAGTSFLNPGTMYETVSDVPLIPPRELEAAPAGSTARGQISDACFSIPATADRLRDLAEQVTAGQTNDYDRVRAILKYIDRTCTYSLLEEPTPEGEDAVEYYLFTTRVGACDLAASAAVMLCRAAGVPAR